MAWWSKIARVFQNDRLRRELDEEFRAHIEDAINGGSTEGEARRAFGSPLRHREASSDVRMATWLASLYADVVFGWRQLTKNRITSAAAILSIGLGLGASLSAFRLIDALLLRPLPVIGADRLYAVTRQEMNPDYQPTTFDGWAYPVFQRMRASVKDQAELIAISYADRTEVTYRSEDEIEKAYVQYVSGWMFNSFGLKPAAGRLLREEDDREPGVDAFAVLSYDYWTSRFAQDPRIVGRAFHLAGRVYEVVGVCEKGFTGTEPGTVIDIFLPTMMWNAVTRSDSTWHRTLALLKSGAAPEPIRQRLNAISLAFEQERAKGFTNMSERSIANYLRQTVVMDPASSGISGLQQSNRRALGALAVLVSLVLLIASVNVANLMTAQAAVRAREMALRVAIGAGRARLVQLMLVESTLLAFAAAVCGAFFAWWSAPFVLGMISSQDNPARLMLPLDGRLCAFGFALIVAVILLFGLAPAFRSSAVAPSSALVGGQDPHARRRMMHILIGVEVAFCVLVLFVGGLFVSTFQRLAHQATGFSADRLLTIETRTSADQPATVWNQLADRLHLTTGVEAVALAASPLLNGSAWNNSVSIHGGPPSDDLTYFLAVSPGWLATMKIPLLSGRDFRPTDSYPGSAIVNETFVKRYLRGENPLGQTVDEVGDDGPRHHLQIAAVTRDARYRGLRDTIPPVAYIPFRAVDDHGVEIGIRKATLIVKSSGLNPLALAPALRKKIQSFGHGFRVNNVRTQAEINDALTIRERLTAVLGAFFSAVALVLAGVGLYGVLAYSVWQRRREIGIRMAIGARAGRIAQLITANALLMMTTGALCGLLAGLLSASYLEPLLFNVRATDFSTLLWPAVAILSAAVIAAGPVLAKAIRIDPAVVLREQ